MTFIDLDPNTILNADAIDCVDFNHVHPGTQERSIRIELRAIPGLTEKRVFLLKYSLEYAQALRTALSSRPVVQPPKELTQERFTEIELFCYRAEEFSAEGTLLVARVPAAGEYLVFKDARYNNELDLYVQVERVIHEIPVLNRTLDSATVLKGDKQQPPATVVIARRCDPPHPMYVRLTQPQ